MLVASMTLLRLRLNAIATKWRALMEIAGNPYRPELYYMRGPGSKWHAKHRLLGRTFPWWYGKSLAVLDLSTAFGSIAYSKHTASATT